MFSRTRRTALCVGAMAQALVLMPWAGTAHAQRWDPPGPGGHRSHWEHPQRDDHYRRERERDRDRQRRDDAAAAGLVVGVVGTAVLASVIAAGAQREKDARARADYCVSRYGNYDRATDTYRAADGYAYRCR